MTRVRLVIEDALLGDVEIEHDDRIGSFSQQRQRKAITELLTAAYEKAYRAYQLENEADR